MLTKITLVILALLPINQVRAQAVLIPSRLSQDVDHKKWLIQHPNDSSLIDYWTQAELENQTGLESLVGEVELALQSKTKWETFESKLGLIKQMGFGQDHRLLLLDYFEKSTESNDAGPKSSKKSYYCAEMKLEDLDRQQACAAREISMHSLQVDESQFPRAIIDGVEVSTQRLKHLSLPPIPMRFAFVSEKWLPIVFVGKPENLLKLQPALEPVLDTQKTPFRLTRRDSKLEETGRYLDSDGELQRLAISSSPISSSSWSENWWSENKSWAGPSLLVLAGAMIYSQRDKTLVIGVP